MSDRRYGKWAGEPEGHREDPNDCVWEVWDNDRWGRGRQCLRKRGHGTDGLYCPLHAKRNREQLQDAGLSE